MIFFILGNVSFLSFGLEILVFWFWWNIGELSFVMNLLLGI